MKVMVIGHATTRSSCLMMILLYERFIEAVFVGTLSSSIAARHLYEANYPTHIICLDDKRRDQIPPEFQSMVTVYEFNEYMPTWEREDHCVKFIEQLITSVV